MRLFRYAYKSAITGKFVSQNYANRHRRTTFRVRIWFWQKEPSA